MMQILITIGIVAAAMLLLSVGVIFRKDHSFRSQHIHQNERMKRDGIQCIKAQDKAAQIKASNDFKRSQTMSNKI
jgi:hypothetical protein